VKRYRQEKRQTHLINVVIDQNHTRLLEQLVGHLRQMLEVISDQFIIPLQHVDRVHFVTDEQAAESVVRRVLVDLLDDFVVRLLNPVRLDGRLVAGDINDSLVVAPTASTHHVVPHVIGERASVLEGGDRERLVSLIKLVVGNVGRSVSSRLHFEITNLIKRKQFNCRYGDEMVAMTVHGTCVDK
jgi:hypothetical protein